MSDKFTLEIISPEGTILKVEASEVVIPSYEGEMGILKDHIPLITFLRPGFIQVHTNDSTKKFYIEFIFLIFLGAATSLSLPPFNYIIINFITGLYCINLIISTVVYPEMGIDIMPKTFTCSPCINICMNTSYTPMMSN